jgi:hypothetical protein
MPSSTLGIFHRRWIESFFVWGAWPVLATTLSTLMTAVNIGSVGAVLNAGSVLGVGTAMDGAIAVGIASLFIAISIATIPFVAKRILMGEFGAVAGLMLIVSRFIRFGHGAGAESGAVARGSGSGGGAITATATTATSTVSGAAPSAGISPNSTLGSAPDSPPPSGETRLFNASA